MDKREINLIYKHTHKDFRGILDGKKSVMYLDPLTGATTYGPIESLPYTIYAEKLDYAIRREDRLKQV